MSRDDCLIIDGKRYPVTDHWTEAQSTDGRQRWGIVTSAPQTATDPAEVEDV